MHTEELVPRDGFDIREYVKRSAFESDCARLIKEDTLFTRNGVPTLLYMQFPGDLGPLRETLKRIEYQQSERTGGLKTTSRVFGYQPRIALRRDFCTATSLASEYAAGHQLVADLGKEISKLYAEYFPGVAKRHLSLTEKVLAEWRMPDTMFTSGIINKNNPLKYHFDAGNFEDVCSCMLGIKRDIGGGHLAMPEYGIKLAIADGSLSIFDGQSILHGVTPIARVTERAYRYTVVYYALKGMWQCAPLSEEVARIKNVKTQRERKRAKDSFVLDQNGMMHGTEASDAGDSDTES